MNKWRGILILAILAAALLAVGAGIAWKLKPPVPLAVDLWHEVPKIKTVTKIKTVKVPGPKEVVTVEKEKVVEKLKLPEWVKADKDQQVISTAEVPAHEAVTDAVALLNTQTGTSQILVKPRPLPFFGTPNEWEVSAGYGISTDGKQVAQVDARWTFLRIGDIRVAGYIEGNNKPEGKVLIKAYVRK